MYVKYGFKSYAGYTTNLVITSHYELSRIKLMFILFLAVIDLRLNYLTM